MNTTLVIVGVILPPMFPPDMVPEQGHEFMADMLGRTLVEATLAASEKGMLPLVGPLPEVGKNYHTFCLTLNGLNVPFAVVLGERAFARVLH